MSSNPRGSAAPQDQLVMWKQILDALALPAAVVNSHGTVMTANQLSDVEVGSKVVRHEGVVHTTTRDGEMRLWTLVKIDDNGEFWLATSGIEEASDPLIEEFFHSGDSFYVVNDQAGRVLQANNALCEIFGYSQDDITMVDTWALVHESDRTHQDEIERELYRTGRSQPTLRMRVATGEYRMIRWSLIYDQSKKRTLGTGRDITDELQAQIELTRRAYSDDLTGLANRSALLEEVDRWQQGPFQPAVLFCDLDRFKRVNDSLGHHAGDILLRSLGTRLTSLFSGPDTVVARYGGDEFVILLGAATTKRAMDAATGVLEQLEKPFDVLGHEIHLAMSIGVALDSPEGLDSDASSLIERADAAAYQAKRNGANSVALSGSTSAKSHISRIDIEDALREALTSEQIDVQYDPILRLPSRAVIGMEARYVWPKVIGAPVDEKDYRAIAEEAGLMPGIGLLVARKALKDLASLSAGGTDVVLGLPSSTAELTVPGYAARLAKEIDQAGINPRMVAVNLDPNATVAATEIRPQIDILRENNIRVALKQFGSRFSCLERLSELELDVVTIDQGLIRDLASHEVSNTLVTSLIQLFIDMKLDVAIEGVTTHEQALSAHELGVRFGQPPKSHPSVPLSEIASGIAKWADRGDGDILAQAA